MENTEKKMDATARQKLIIHSLKKENRPITGSEFAEMTNVSRQVIVQDISLLRAKNEPILSTSQGYLYLDNQQDDNKVTTIIAVKHTPAEVQKELHIIVDHGVTVKDITVEHAVYGELKASIMVSTRADVSAFIKKIDSTNAPYLSTLSNGIHLHTLEADSQDKIAAACSELAKENILLEVST